jgi:mono/diheme cytochrome c family protein
MSFPVWELDTLGGSLLIALIAVTHAYVAQLAVGGGLFLWLTELRAQRRGDVQLTRYVHRHTRFFLLLTMVFGGVSGVGIWFVIGLVHPTATSSLIHTFVFGWAIEWVFFLVEVVALLIFHYRYEQLDDKTRAQVAMVYALAAWLSLFVINGILSFMLTPGGWLNSGDFWQGFFNPTFFPSLAYRSFASLLFAGLFAGITAVATADADERQRLLRWAGRWLLLPMVGLAASGYWYLECLPAEIARRTFIENPETRPFVLLFIGGAAVVFVLGVLSLARLPRILQGAVTALLIVAGLGWSGGFEYMREIARKPYIIYGYMYSNGIKVSDLPALRKSGLLAASRWSAHKTITPANERAVGRDLFNVACASCHTRGGIYNDVGKRSGELSKLGIEAVIEGMGVFHDYMPPWVGKPAERRALAAHIAYDVLGRREVAPASPPKRGAAPKPAKIDNSSEYLLLAWNDLGMHCISDGSPNFVILPPANTLEAQLIKRADSPEIVTKGVELRYRVEKGHEHPSRHLAFWKHSAELFGEALPPDVGLSGKGMAGTMELEKKLGTFVASHIPVAPYKDDGSFSPYPLFTIEARDAKSKKLLATTQVVAPTSTEMGCGNCHGGGWRKAKLGVGISAKTSTAILALHDRDNGTRLLARAKGGKAILCAECHADPALGKHGKGRSPGTQLNLSASIHGFHASFMPLAGGKACGTCHPSDPKGRTGCLRGVHASRKLDCTRCHGSLGEHAAALLKAEVAAGKARAKVLLAPLRGKLTQVKSLAEVKPRKPWVNQPDCMTCHVKYTKPKPGASGFNVWTKDANGLFRRRRGESDAVRCAACHGSPHALYPARNPFVRYRDNLQPLRASGLPFPLGSNNGCAACHGEEMSDSPHHDNMEGTFRGKAPK